MKMRRFGLIIVALVMLISCNGMQTDRELSHTPAPEVALNDVKDEILTKAINAPRGVEYILGPEDLIDIEVFQVEELKKTIRINAGGSIKLPVVGKLKVSGLTVPELEETVEDKLSNYIQNPEVSVFIKEFRSQRITLLGAVKKQQVYTVTGQNYLLDIISRADGLSEDAGEICYVQRKKETIIIDMRGLLYEGDTRLNIPVFGGDVVYIPRGGTIFVSGAVEGPGSYPVKGKLTLTQAIAMAKDFKEYAKKGEIQIYRDIGKGERQVIGVDYDRIMEENSSDVMLQDKDVVFVPASGVKRAVYGVLKSFRWVVNVGSVDIGAGFVY
jgi:polysaccharide export outer membrane protein